MNNGQRQDSGFSATNVRGAVCDSEEKGRESSIVPFHNSLELAIYADINYNMSFVHLYLVQSLWCYFISNKQ